MRRGARRRWFVLLAAAAVLAACSARGFTPPLSLPAHSGIEDRGRRAAHDTVETVVVLRLRNAAGLAALVERQADPASPQFRHFLTPQAFADRFSPTVADYAKLVTAMRRAGFTISHTYRNRLLVDASAPSAVAERFFRTEIHDFSQDGYGRRYANVRPVRVPPALAGIVAHVELDSIVYARADGAFEDGSQDAGAQTIDAVKNGGFENGLHAWRSCDKVALSTLHPFKGKHSALIGSLTPASGNVKGIQVLCQRVVIPNGAVLRAHTWAVTNVTDERSGGYQEIGFMKSPGKTAIVLHKGLANKAHWELQRFPLSSQLAGRTLYLFFAVAGKGQKNLYDSLFVDNVSLVGVAPTPTPSGSPSPTPTPTPVGPGPGQPLTGPTFGPKGWAPRGIADGLDLPVQHGWDGRGTTMAVLTQATLKASDLNAFFAANQITRTGTIVEKPVPPTPSSSSDPTEEMLDVETMAALAPGANVIAYEMRDFSHLSILDGYERAINDNAASVVAASFGECETDSPSYDTAIENAAISAAALGITFVASSGDEGAACPVPGAANDAGVQVPASNPHVLSVGGNDSDTTIGAANPVVWNGNNGFFSGASGGGVSSQWPIPSYQNGLAGAASTKGRNVPDISFPAVEDDLYLYGIDETVGGTTWSSSIAAAALVQSVEICGRLGYVNPALYAAFAKNGEGGAFTDVTSGTNQYAAFPTFYTAAAGYDNASGIGIPRGVTFAAALCGKFSTLWRGDRR